jgi:hypothetical protein
MKNHWLNKKKEKEEDFDIELAYSEITPGLRPVCISGIVDPTLISVQTVTISPPFGNALLNVYGYVDAYCSIIPPSSIADPTLITVQTVSCMDFEPGQTALSELDDFAKHHVSPAGFGGRDCSPNLEIGDGSMKYTREIQLGPFTFKDSDLGIDIFLNDVRMGWLNCRGEESLFAWLKEKHTAKQDGPDQNYCLKSLSNYSISCTCRDTLFSEELVLFGRIPDGYDGDLGESFYKFDHDNVVPGSLVVTFNGKIVQIPAYGHEVCAELFDIGVKTISVDYNKGNISIEWSKTPGVINVNLQYEYEVKV